MKSRFSFHYTFTATMSSEKTNQPIASTPIGK